MGAHAHPEITMHTYPLSRYMEYIYRDDWQGVAELMVSSAELVAKTGATFAICPDNTIHQAFDYVEKHSVIPWLHIAREVATVASAKGFTKLGVLGTKYLMEGPVYVKAVEQRGLEREIPTDEQRQRVNQIIFDELVYGKFEGTSRQYFSDVIVSLKERGCDAVVLGCTEIPLLITQENSVLPVLDSTRILAHAALAKATSKVTSKAK